MVIYIVTGPCDIMTWFWVYNRPSMLFYYYYLCFSQACVFSLIPGLSDPLGRRVGSGTWSSGFPQNTTNSKCPDARFFLSPRQIYPLRPGLRNAKRNAARILFCRIVYKNKPECPPRLLFEHLGSGSTLKHRCGTETYAGQSKPGNLVKMPGLENEPLRSSDQT